MMDSNCWGCFGLLRKHRKPQSKMQSSRECLLSDSIGNGENVWTEEIFMSRVQNGLLCREVSVKETKHVTQSKDEHGNKMLNGYVRECHIGSGSYAKVILYQSIKDKMKYAIKVFNKSHLLKVRVAPSETAMSDVLREVAIMKMLDHPNIVNLIEVIDDPNTDNFYMVLEYVEGKWVCEGSSVIYGLDEDTSKRYLRDIVSGLMYLHSHKVVHGDIKPDNLLITTKGNVKIGDFSVSQVFKDDNDEIKRSPGTPVFTAPECCLGLPYHGKAADVWAVGVTLYCMIVGQYPFLGDSLQDTYDKIVNNALYLPVGMNPSLQNLLEALLCKDPTQRITLGEVAKHPWVIDSVGPIPEYVCTCKRRIIVDQEKNLSIMGNAPPLSDNMSSKLPIDRSQTQITLSHR